MLLRLARWLAAVLALVVLDACVSNATVVDTKATVEQAADEAIVIVSVSHDRNAGGGGWARFIIDGDSPQAAKVQSTAGKLELPIKNHFRDKYGHVYVLELPPGHHKITSWNATWRNEHTNTVVGVPLEFDVARGQVVYIGNLHVGWLMGRTPIFNMRAPYAAFATIQDQSAIDIPIAEKMNPAIATRARNALLPLGPWGKAPPVPDMGSPGEPESSSGN